MIVALRCQACSERIKLLAKAEVLSHHDEGSGVGNVVEPVLRLLGKGVRRVVEW